MRLDINMLHVWSDTTLHYKHGMTLILPIR